MTWVDAAFFAFFYVAIGIAICAYLVTVKGYRDWLIDWVVGVIFWPLVLWACD